MKQFLFLLLFVFILGSVNSQYTKLVIQLKDKNNNTYSLSNPSQFLSPRAIQRRTKYNIPYDSTDLPITQSYLISIALVNNVNVLSVSKWLNRVLIQTTDPSAIATIQSFSFVSSVSNVAPRAISGNGWEKFKEEIQPLFPQKNQKVEGNVFNYGNNYNQVHIHEGEFLHNKGFNGETMQIAVLDAGFYQYNTVTAFDSIRLNNQILGQRDFVNFDGSVTEDDTHGMYCLSTMAANWPGRMVGTATKAKYWLVRTENAPTEYPVEEFNWVVGAEFADSTGSDLISSSLGYNTFDATIFNHTYSEFYKNIATVTRGAALAAKKGIIVMNSAGNEGNSPWKYIGFPADADSVCAVGATNSQGVIASFSSRGYPGKIKPNIVSVGANAVIAGLNNQPSSGNGTSFSNPNIAGLVTCLWQAFPLVNNMKILDAVYKSAHRYSTPDSAYGYGIPNFKTAYRLLKHDQNVLLYGNDWLWATPNPFDSVINVRFIGRKDGNTVFYLKNSAGVVLKKKNFITEVEEVYTFNFDTLSGLPGGYYTVEYDDTTTTRTITLHKGAIFPLELISFTGSIVNNQAQLQWITQVEMGVKSYELLRSGDGTNFNTINTGKPFYGVSQNRYSYIDAAPLSEGYYRLKTVNFDGSSSLSNIVLLKLNTNQLLLHYDALNTVVKIKSIRSNSDKLQVMIYSADGKQVLKKEKSLPSGINEMNISLLGYVPGVYIVSAETGAGKKTIKAKL